MYEGLERFVEPRKVNPDLCPTCGHEGRSRAQQSLRHRSGHRQRQRRCIDCGAHRFTVELSRDALMDLVAQLGEAERQLAHAHSADLDDVLTGIRSALRALETPYRARKDQHEHPTAKRGPQRARAVAQADAD